MGASRRGPCTDHPKTLMALVGEFYRSHLAAHDEDPGFADKWQSEIKKYELIHPKDMSLIRRTIDCFYLSLQRPLPMRTSNWFAMRMVTTRLILKRCDFPSSKTRKTKCFFGQLGKSILPD